MKPADYKNLSAKKEAELVPAWVTVSSDGRSWLLYSHVALEFIPHTHYAVALQVPGMSYQQWCSLFHPQEFAKAVCRLPRRLQA